MEPDIVLIYLDVSCVLICQKYFLEKFKKLFWTHLFTVNNIVLLIQDEAIGSVLSDVKLAPVSISVLRDIDW